MSRTGRSTLFVSLPISENLTSGGTFRPERKASYSIVFDELVNYDITIESAALHEDWGRIQMDPSDFSRYDFDALRRADALLAVTCTQLTNDLYLEIGFAAARGIPLAIVLPWRCRVTYMINGLVETGCAMVRQFDSESELTDIVNDVLPRLLPSAIDDRPPIGADRD